jgi:outer membrane protein TolC
VCRGVLPACLLIALAGCQPPLISRDADDALRASVETAVAREIAGAGEPQPEPNVTTQPPGEVEAELADRREELDAIGPMQRVTDPTELGPDLVGKPQESVSITLETAIREAVNNNLAVQQARLLPAIAEADVVAAEAVFDALWFSNADLSKTDQPTTVPVVSGVPLGTTVNGSERYRFETGIRRQLTSGGQFSVSTDLTRTENNSPGITLTPDPAYISSVRVGVTQPLLRGFGSDVNTAAIRVARNSERRSIQELRNELLRVAEETERSYWELAFAWHDLAVTQWLVEVGIEVRDVLAKRFDTRQAEYSDAVATVEQRKADVIRARRQIREASDALKVLLNDPEVTVGSEVILSPVDEMIEAPITYSLRDAMLTAVEERPEVQQAILDIDDATVRQLVADSNRLPLLNLSAEMAYFGLDGDWDSSYDELFEGDFIDYIVGLALEVPLGNRQAEAEFRRARLQRSGAVIRYRQVIQAVIRDVKARLRDVITNFELIQATRSNRIAQAENLRALLVEEETLAGLTPEFLNLKFQRQDRLALARREELQAMVAFDQSLAALYRAMGIGLDMNGITLELVDSEGAGAGGANAPDS